MIIFRLKNYCQRANIWLNLTEVKTRRAPTIFFKRQMHQSMACEY